jgi:hypothetical protein
MSEYFCKTCKKNLDISEFTLNSKIFKTCNICRKQSSERRRKNICDVCGIIAYYNVIGEKIGIRCKTHKDINMVDVKSKKCLSEGCLKQPSFNKKDEKIPLYCATHKAIGMVNIKSPKCEFDGCLIKPYFNLEGETKGIFCSEHKLPGMINIYDNVCIFEKCKKLASYNIKGQKKPLYCSEHKLPNMIDLKTIKCAMENCKTKPCFNLEGETKGLYCVKHKLPDMVDVVNKKCVYEGCTTQPHFNYKNINTAIYCSEHKLPNMVDIKNNICNFDGCLKIASFNTSNEKKRLYCSEHKLPGMINLANTKCNFDGCDKIPNYNIKGHGKGIYCITHKKPNMVDVKHSICDEVNCLTRSSYGYIGQHLTRCARHKLPLMFKITKVICDEDDCCEISEYGIDEPLHCYLHQKDEEYCLVGKKCINCNRENELCNKDGLCYTYCKPTEMIVKSKKYIKKKESLVLAYLDKNIKSDIEPFDDKIIDTLCVKRRPDRLYDCGLFYVICEIDENQHNGSNYTGCVFSKDNQELRRMIQIHEALNMGTIPCIFIRFNPDSFKVNGKIKKINMQKRLDVLSKWINYCLNINFEKEFKSGNQIYIKHLFYDDYDETNISFETIDDDNIKKLII